MPTQLGRNTRVAFKVQAVAGAAETGAGATLFRFTDNTAGLSMSKAKVRSSESKANGMSVRGRHGSRSVAGTYPADATLGTYEALIAAALRTTPTWAASLVVTQATASLTSITTTNNTIIASAGSWITAGLKIGDVVVLTGHQTTANNSKNLLITALTASTITVRGYGATPSTPLTADAAPDTSFTITRAKKATNGTTRSIFTFEEIEDDNDASSQFRDCRANSWKVSYGADSVVKFEFGLIGLDMAVLTGASSPGFTNPTVTSSLELVAVDATLHLGGTPIATLTSLDFMTTLNTKLQPVAGSTVSPDVYEGNMAPIAGSFSCTREDMTLLSGFAAETEYSVSLMLAEGLDAEPKDYMSIYLPLATLDANTKALGVDGPLIQTVTFEAGQMLSGTNVDNTMICVQSTGA